MSNFYYVSKKEYQPVKNDLIELINLVQDEVRDYFTFRFDFIGIPGRKRKGECLMAVNITKETFEELVLASEKPVLLDFWAQWCMPCKMLAPVLEEISAQRQDILVAKVDVDAEPELARKYRVMSIPTVLVMKNGEVVNRSVGFRPMEELLALLDK